MAGRGSLCGGWNRCAYVLFAIYVNGAGGQAGGGSRQGSLSGWGICAVNGTDVRTASAMKSNVWMPASAGMTKEPWAMALAPGEMLPSM